MTVPATVKTSWSDKLTTTFRASPGKISTAGGLAVILMVLWARFLFWGHHPAAASGAVTQTSVGSLPAIRRTLASAHTGDDAAFAPGVGARPVQPMAPILLQFRWIFTRDGTKVSDDSASPGGYWDLVRKSMSSRADQQEQRQILIDNVRIAADALKLQSTVTGAHPGAMMNGQMVREGDSVAGFRVVKIEARQVIVEREGVQLAVLME